MGILTETDIANRALQRVGAARLQPGTLRTGTGKNATEIVQCYDILRRAELRRNVWRFAIRMAALRAIGLQTKQINFAVWAVGTAYKVNDVVVGSDGSVYSALIANTGNDPTTSLTNWTRYFGPLFATEYVMTWSGTPTFAVGDHTIGSDGAVYISIVAGNVNHNPVGDAGVHWVVTTDGVQANSNSYFSGELVYVGNQVYISLQNDNGLMADGNTSPPGTATWLLLSTQPTLAVNSFIYPIGTGPSQQSSTRNIYRLPYGFLREAPQDPKAGSTLFLGAPSALKYTDWNYEGNYITTTDSGVITLRFAADVSDPSFFDALFVEGLGSRIAFEICEPLTQSTAKLQAIMSEYKAFMSEARTVNGIETGATQPPEDDYIACRI